MKVRRECFSRLRIKSVRREEIWRRIFNSRESITLQFHSSIIIDTTDNILPSPPAKKHNMIVFMIIISRNCKTPHSQINVSHTFHWWKSFSNSKNIFFSTESHKEYTSMQVSYLHLTPRRFYFKIYFNIPKIKIPETEERRALCLLRFYYHVRPRGLCRSGTLMIYQIHPAAN